jgi:ketosteroid isomerase-like protein
VSENPPLSDVEIVRDQFEAVNERDFERAMDRYADDVVLVVHPGWFETGTFEGKEAVGEWFGQWFRLFDASFRFEIGEARAIGGVVFLHAELYGVGRSSGAPAHAEAGYLYEVRDGKVARAEIFKTRGEALEAAASRG